MNERIRELAVEADLLIKKSNGDEFRYGNFDPRFQKFAELIVEKCVKCSDPLISHYINNHTEQDQAMLLAAIADYSSEIKKHFGVKE